MECVKELFRSAGGVATIDDLALALFGAPREKNENDIKTLSRILEVNLANHQDWPSSEFVEGFIAASGALIREQIAELSNVGSGRA
jgi:hypothetical protein